MLKQSDKEAKWEQWMGPERNQEVLVLNWSVPDRRREGDTQTRRLSAGHNSSSETVRREGTGQVSLHSVVSQLDREREREGGGRENNRRERDGRTVSTCSLEHTTTADVH